MPEYSNFDLSTFTDPTSTDALQIHSFTELEADKEEENAHALYDFGNYDFGNNENWLVQYLKREVE